MNRKVYLIALLLVAFALALITVKVIYGGARVDTGFSPHLWRIKIVMNIKGLGQRAKVRFTLPKNSERQRIYNEHFENDELVFYVRDRQISGNRIGFWRSELLDGTKSLQYTFSVQLKKQSFPIPEELEIPKDPIKAYPPAVDPWLKPSAYIQSKSILIQKHLKTAIGKEKKTARVMRKIFDFVRGEVHYRSEKGSKDAKATLKQLIADCGGQARLFAALSRAANIPSRIVGGVILEPSGFKTTTHVWVENYIGGQWIPFDVVNNYFAMTPAHYIEFYRGDYVLFKHVGLAKFEYFFVIGKERIPPVDNPFSLYVLPIHFQKMIKVLLLIPVGALVVAFFRTVIGVPTFGTFAPVLLALAFREVSPLIGLVCLLIVISLGWLIRRMLDHLKILVIPRLSIIVTLVVFIVLALIVIFYHLGQNRVLFISLFPMIIMTWTVERFSVLQIEDGTPAALKAAAGTALVATAAYYLMKIKILRLYLFAFPELLLVIMALMLVLGRYTGLRLSELWRFREFLRSSRKRIR